MSPIKDQWESPDGSVRLILGDCLHCLPLFEENTFDAVAVDPPYGLGEQPDMTDVLTQWLATGEYAGKSKKGFMGKAWDAFVPGPRAWREVFRVLKPGGHAVVFAGTRTFDLMGIALRMAGFKLRDTLMWIHGQGFSKGLNLKRLELCSCIQAGQPAGEPADIRDARSPLDAGTLRGRGACPSCGKMRQEYKGFSTQLKPAWEPILLVRKPLSEPTVAANVLRWGTGALNIEACRVEAEPELAKNWHRNQSKAAEEGRNAMNGGLMAIDLRSYTPQGRWPGNVTHDGSPQVLAGFPVTGVSSGGITPRKTEFLQGVKANGDDMRMTGNRGGLGDTGSAARFFYCAKSSRNDRGEDNRHPTVKSTELMRWLLRLITPPDGLVLDCFLGSGSTAVAAYNENFRIIGIEQEREYWEIAVRRVRAELERFPLFEQAAKPRQRELIP